MIRRVLGTLNPGYSFLGRRPRRQEPWGGFDRGIGERVINAVDYGLSEASDNNSDAIVAAVMDAAGSASARFRGVVQLPSGSFKVQPKGTLRIRMYTKANGHWSVPQLDVVGSDVSAVNQTYTKGADIGGYPAWYAPSSYYLAYDATEATLCLFSPTAEKMWVMNRAWDQSLESFLYDGCMTVTGGVTYSVAGQYLRKADVGGYKYWERSDGYYITRNTVDGRWSIYSDLDVELYSNANFPAKGGLTYTEVGGADTCTVTNDAIRTEINLEVQDEQYGSWHVYDVDPTAGVGVNGEWYLNRRKNKVWQKVAGAWQEHAGGILEGSGSGWFANWWYPMEHEGADGDIFIQYRLQHDGPVYSIFYLTEAWNNTTLRGAGKANTTIQYRLWGDKAADDYQKDNSLCGEDLTSGIRVFKRNDGKWYHTDDATATLEGIAMDNKSAGTAAVVMVRSNILPSQYFYPNPGNTAAENRFYRGNLFVLKPDQILYNWRLEDLTANGGADVNYQDSWYTGYDDIDRWDIHHKCLASWQGHVVGLQLNRCNLTRWRGEIVYGGGGLLREYTLTDTDLSQSNASALSVSGHVKMYNCNIVQVYNGVENFGLIPDDYPSRPQFTEMYDCTIDMTPGGAHGMAWLGSPGTHLTLDGCTIINRVGILFDGAAHNVTFRNTEFRDCDKCLYLHNINAGYYGITSEWRDFTFDTVTFRATTKGILYGIQADQNYQQLGTWNLDGVNFVEENGQEITLGIEMIQTVGTVNIANSNFSALNRKIEGAVTALCVDGGGNTGITWPL